MFGKRAVFLDRDGTVVEIVHRPDFKKKFTAPFTMDELQFVPDVMDIMNEFRSLGFLRIMITNQPDVAHGYVTEETWSEIHQTIVRSLRFDDVFMCRHASADNCPLKKPSSMMLRAAADKWGIDLRSSYMIGDSDVDMIAGKDAGCRTIFIGRACDAPSQSDRIVGSLKEAFRVVNSLENQGQK